MSNLASFSQFSCSCLDEKSQVDVIYTDFQKAFDQIDRFVFLDKVKSQFGFSDHLSFFTHTWLVVSNMWRLRALGHPHLTKHQEFRKYPTWTHISSTCLLTILLRVWPVKN